MKQKLVNIFIGYDEFTIAEGSKNHVNLYYQSTFFKLNIERLKNCINSPYEIYNTENIGGFYLKINIKDNTCCMNFDTNLENIDFNYKIIMKKDEFKFFANLIIKLYEKFLVEGDKM